MGGFMISRFRRFVQNSIIYTLRPYVSRELPGWGPLYNFAADFHREWLWSGAPTREMQSSLTGYTTRHDLSKWFDRGTYFLGRWHDLGMQSFLSDTVSPTDTIVDVGANRGEFSLFASHLVKHGKVIAFEPNPQCLEILRGDIVRNSIGNIEVIPAGLSNYKETLTMSVPSGSTVEGTFSKVDDPNVSSLQLQVIVGDAALTQEHPAIVKIDVEGFECKVVAGLAKTIARCRPIIITEVIREHLERCGDSPEQLRDAIEIHGYTGFEMGLQKRNGKYIWALTPIDLQRAGFDAVWLPTEKLTLQAHTKTALLKLPYGPAHSVIGEIASPGHTPVAVDVGPDIEIILRICF